MPWEKVEPILRPDRSNVHMGVMRVDQSKCTQCGLCMRNCPLRAWEEDEGGYPALKEIYECFSCYNCKVACPSDAKKESNKIKQNSVPTLNPEQWEFLEKEHKRKPTKKEVLDFKEIEKAVTGMLKFYYNTYINDETVKNLVSFAEESPGGFDPRPISAIGTFVKGESMNVALDAPVVILILGDKRAISAPEVNIGICGQNMNLVANSIGIKACWNGFMAAGIEALRPLKKKLGIKAPWKVVETMCLGYPAFKQEGVVPREARPVTWFREGADGPEIQE